MSTTTDQTTTTATSDTVATDPSTRTGGVPAATPQTGRARRWTDSPVLVGAAALAAGGLVAVAVAAAVVVVTGSTPSAPVATAAVTTVEDPSTGDARQGLTPDAATRRLGGTSPFYVADSADSADRRAAVGAAGLLAWDSAGSAARRAYAAGLVAHDSADSADRRSSTVAGRSGVAPDSTDSATRRATTGSAPSAGDARTGLAPDSATRR